MNPHVSAISRKRRPHRAGLFAAALMSNLAVVSIAGAALGRNDVLINLNPQANVSVIANGATVGVQVVNGTVSLQTDTPTCVASSDHPCSYIVNFIRIAFRTFPFSGQTVGNPYLVLNGPVPVVDDGSGIVIPAGTNSFFAADISGVGRRETIHPTPAPTIIALDLADQQAEIIGAFVVDFDAAGQNVHAVGTYLIGANSPFFNVPPVANAGPDQTLPCPGPVTLDGSGTTDPNNNLGDLIWLEGETQIGLGTRPVVNLSAGTHVITLHAFDTNGAMSTDTVTITIASPQPVFTFVPPPITRETCGAISVGMARATYACGTVTVTSDAPASFFAGVTTVTFTATSSDHTVATATTTVTVLLGNDARCCPPGSHVIIGTSNNDVLNGTSGNDCILGLGAQDIINGNGGNDIISGGDGDDVITCGGGNDFINAGSGQDRVVGGGGNDVIYGGDGDDTLFGGDGDDVMHGGQGQDRVNGEAGNDRLFGNDGDDTLNGGTGNDVLNGGGIHDLCIGGGGSDSFFMCERIQ